MNHLEDAAAQAGHAAGVSNSDPCIVPLAPGSNDSQCALDELDVSQVSCRGAINLREQHPPQHAWVVPGVPALNLRLPGYLIMHVKHILRLHLVDRRASRRS
jgi:hypothetical protein